MNNKQSYAIHHVFVYLSIYLFINGLVSSFSKVLCCNSGIELTKDWNVIEVKSRVWCDSCVSHVGEKRRVSVYGTSRE